MAKDFIDHVEDVPWYKAPMPRRWHKCKPQSSGIISGDKVERCACGAIRLIQFGDVWIDRNSRREGKRP